MIKLKYLLESSIDDPIYDSLLAKEMAMGSYNTVGSFDVGRSFSDKRDRQLITHPVAIEKVRDFFKNTTVDFDLYFVNLSGRRKFAEKGIVSSDFIFDKYPSGLGITPDQLAGGKINSNNVTVFFVGNSAAEKVPMTAWTMAHRLGHSIRREYSWGVFMKWLESTFSELLKLYNISKPNPYDRNFDKASAKLFNQIGTMRSAREGKIDRPAEFYYELFAQYLKSGSVKFNRLSNSIVKGHGAYGRKDMASTQNLDDVNDILDGIERDFHYYAEDVLSDIVGKIFVM